MQSSPSVPCVDTTVGSIASYFPSDPASGVVISFKTHLCIPESLTKVDAGITERTAESVVAVILQERVGDAVQVCLLAVPKPDDRCHPETDERGRVYRVYDYRLKTAYTGSLGNHDCGGA